MRILLSLLAFVCIYNAGVRALPPSWQEVDESYSFEQFIQDFSKHYASEEERELRAATFKRNLHHIIQHNSQKKTADGYALGVNHLMDMDPSEMPRGFDKSMHWQMVSSLATGLEASPHLMPLPFEIEDVSTLPKEVDWRKKNILTPVKDQGTCGSCWAFASTEVLESHIALQTGFLFTLSVQEIVSCAPNIQNCGGTGGCNGSTAELAYDFVVNHGIVEEWQFGYVSYHGEDAKCPFRMSMTKDEEPHISLLRGNDSSSSSSKQAKPSYPVAAIEGFAMTPVNDYKAVMNAVAKHGPIVVYVASTSDWHFYAGGVFTQPDKDPSSYDLNHLVALVGYGTDEETGEDYWLVRNSKGPRWGEKGYIRLKRQDPTKMENPDDDCGMDITPANGNACTRDDNGKPISPPATKICGTSGVYYLGVLPLGGRLA